MIEQAPKHDIELDLNVIKEMMKDEDN